MSGRTEPKTKKNKEIFANCVYFIGLRTPESALVEYKAFLSGKALALGKINEIRNTNVLRESESPKND